MNLLVTGGLGYIGGRFAQYATAMNGIRVTLTSRRVPAAAATPQAVVAQVDPLDERRLAELCRDVDAVVNLAGMNAAAAGLAPETACESRVKAISALLRAARTQGVRRLIQVSTAHVYGAALAGEVDEATVPRPQHPYGRSHLAAEEVVRAARERGEIEGIVVRLSNSFGAPASPDADCWDLVVNNLCRQAVTERRMLLRTTGAQRRDFIAMSEVCRALLFLCRLPSGRVAHPTYNLGGNDAPTLAGLAERIAARVAERLAFRPEVRVGTVQDAVGTAVFEFRTARLAAAGFEHDPAAARAELDGLIEFCARQGGSP